MKFALLALIGVVSAKNDETELVGKRWRWRHIPNLMAQEARVARTMEEIEREME